MMAVALLFAVTHARQLKRQRIGASMKVNCCSKNYPLPSHLCDGEKKPTISGYCF
jgi:hypothetical protein